MRPKHAIENEMELLLGKFLMHEVTKKNFVTRMQILLRELEECADE